MFQAVIKASDINAKNGHVVHARSRSACAFSPRDNCATHVSPRVTDVRIVRTIVSNCHYGSHLSALATSLRMNLHVVFCTARTNYQRALIAHIVVYEVFVGLYGTTSTSMPDFTGAEWYWSRIDSIRRVCYVMLSIMRSRRHSNLNCARRRIKQCILSFCWLGN